MPTLITSSVKSTVTDFTCTLNGLSSSATAARQSTRLTIDQSAGPLSHLIQLKLVIGSGTIGGDKRVYLYVWGSLASDVYPADMGATDAGVTLLAPTELLHLLTVPIPTASKTYSPTVDTSIIWPSGLPPYYGVVVRNYCGISLGSGSKVSYMETRLATE